MKSPALRVSCTDLKSALVLALQLAEKGVDGLPIPGVKGCIGGILKIIEQEELREDNIETFNGLVNMIKRFQEVTVERLSKDRNIPENLKSDVEGLAKMLRDIPARYEERIGQRSRMMRWKDFFSAGDHAKALNGLGEDLKNAIQEFQTASLVNIQLMEQKREDDRLIDKLPVEHKAFYNAHRERPIEVCEPDTRVSLLADVAEWAEGTGPNHPGILWLNGQAGVGKSTVAKALATRFDSMKTLGGSFMFSKPNGVTDGSILFTTLAYQLSYHLPGFRDNLVTAIRAKKASMKVEVARQFEDLLAVPLSQLQSPQVTLIIIDAIDECAAETLTPVLALIVENITRFPFLRIVVTSRPEYPIRQILQQSKGHVREIKLGEISASMDIERYLQRRLRDAYTRLMGDTDQDHIWPADTDVACLVRMANNLFVFAATVVRFVGDEWAAEPRRRLDIILCGQSADGQDHPFSGLDIMYQEILQHALPNGVASVHARFQAVVGTIIFSEYPLSVKKLADLLAPNYSAIDIRHSLKFLHSVLTVPEDDETPGLQVYHKSFADFITDPKRCPLTEAYLCPSTHHTRLCLRHFEMAESEFGALSAGNPSMETCDSYAEAAEPILDATEDMLSQWIHHLHALEDQARMSNKTEEVIPAVSYRAQAFSALITEHESHVKILESGNSANIFTRVKFRFLRRARRRIREQLNEGIDMSRK